MWFLYVHGLNCKNMLPLGAKNSISAKKKKAKYLTGTISKWQRSHSRNLATQVHENMKAVSAILEKNICHEISH